MNTLAEQYQIMRDLENLLDAREVKKLEATETVARESAGEIRLGGAHPDGDIAGASVPAAPALREGDGRPVMAMPAYPSSSQDPLFGEAA